MSYNPLDTFSKNIATAGSFLGLPEMGISERISSPVSPVPYNTTPYFSFGASQAASPAQVLGLTTPSVPFNQGSTTKPTGSFNSLSAAPTNNTNAGYNVPVPNNNAEISKLNTQYDYLNSQGNQQIGTLTDAYNQGINQANTDFNGLTTTVNQQKELAGQARDKNIDQAASTAQNTQRQNRQTLRALGILNSSAAGEMLTKPITEFGKVKAQFVQDYNNRVGQLDDFLNQKTAEHTNLLGQLSNQYQQLVGNIQNDLRFNDRQRTDAINAANAALASKIQDIRTAQQTIRDKVNAQKLQLLQDAGQLEAYKNPDFNYMDFTKNTLIPTLQQSGPQTVGLAGSDYQKRLTQ